MTLNLGPATSVEDNNSGEDNNTVLNTIDNTNEEYSMAECQGSVQGAN